ncbi:hypothetical protein KR038_011926, partial [Drosophila bunnanda]
MNLLIWMCLAVSLASVSGIFFDSKATTGKQGSDDDDFMGGLKQFFGYNADTNTSRHNKTAQESADSSSGFYDEVDTALEHATDSMDGLWQQFKKGLFSLMGSFSAGDEDDDGLSASATASITPAPALQQMKPISNPTSAVSESTLPPTGTPTTVRIITATTTPASTTAIPT